jgi:hypothetical protein
LSLSTKKKKIKELKRRTRGKKGIPAKLRIKVGKKRNKKEDEKLTGQSKARQHTAAFSSLSLSLSLSLSISLFSSPSSSFFFVRMYHNPIYHTQ